MMTHEAGLVVVRGAGDLATGVIVRLRRAGFRVAALEIARPTAIRRSVALCESMYDGEAEVEGVKGRRVRDVAEAVAAAGSGIVPLLEDPECTLLVALRPAVLVDAIIAKRNTGTSIRMAPIVVALGPGFEAGVDAHAVIETNRGHDLGRVILSGRAEADTRTPATIAGVGAGRVVHAPQAGTTEEIRRIGDAVTAGEAVLRIRTAGGSAVEARSSTNGVLRGVIRSGLHVAEGLKVADVDPRGIREHCFTVSDKARAIGGGVLEAILAFGYGR